MLSAMTARHAMRRPRIVAAVALLLLGHVGQTVRAAEHQLLTSPHEGGQHTSGSRVTSSYSSTYFPRWWRLHSKASDSISAVENSSRSTLRRLIKGVGGMLQHEASTRQLSANEVSIAQGQPGPLPYDLDNFSSIQELLKAHQVAQEDVLLHAHSSSTYRALHVRTWDSVGLGNRIPCMVTGYVMALFTKSIFLLESSILQHMELPVSFLWNNHASRYQQAIICGVNVTRLIDSNSTLCSDGPTWDGAALMEYTSIDYDMPFLEASPAFQQYFRKFFPDGEVFHTIAEHLLSKPSQVVQDALQPYSEKMHDCLVGLQVRTRKVQGVQLSQFAGIARALAHSKAGNIFVASDNADTFAGLKSRLLSRDVWWSNLTYQSVGTATTAGGNPGTELSAIVDFLLLGKCRSIVVTPSSSLGAVAAGLAGVRPVYATFGPHHTPFLNTWFWQSITTEPCCFKLGKSHNLDSNLTTAIQQSHPLYLYHNQCHH